MRFGGLERLPKTRGKIYRDGPALRVMRRSSAALDCGGAMDIEAVVVSVLSIQLLGFALSAMGNRLKNLKTGHVTRPSLLASDPSHQESTQ